ncbi:hypothetical protein SBA5_630002 [Candidatus Sulfotelmatomonas gaucii]|uniref:Uncharacterized protein n=1 Tax=Candidatus Sulfuritelmatomonas gaucii TaxID=2043161 RepID=A0A2N9LY18_9BACT|nr:hypothetical protein SBA5_630002 [Candidatus Sulfotelmatomonas gaucii]
MELNSTETISSACTVIKRFFVNDLTHRGAKAILSHEPASGSKEPARYLTVQNGFGIDSFAAVAVSVGSMLARQSVLTGFWQTAVPADRMMQKIVS